LLASLRAHICARRSAWNRVLKEVGCAQRNILPKLVGAHARMYGMTELADEIF
jgi:hypothetical protein